MNTHTGDTVGHVMPTLLPIWRITLIADFRTSIIACKILGSPDGIGDGVMDLAISYRPTDKSPFYLIDVSYFWACFP